MQVVETLTIQGGVDIESQSENHMHGVGCPQCNRFRIQWITWAHANGETGAEGGCAPWMPWGSSLSTCIWFKWLFFPPWGSPMFHGMSCCTWNGVQVWLCGSCKSVKPWGLSLTSQGSSQKSSRLSKTNTWSSPIGGYFGELVCMQWQLGLVITTMGALPSQGNPLDSPRTWKTYKRGRRHHTRLNSCTPSPRCKWLKHLPSKEELILNPRVRTTCMELVVPNVTVAVSSESPEHMRKLSEYLYMV